jgi:prepilin-type processing-associated H-X9-DG protein
MQKGRSIYFCPSAARTKNSGTYTPVRTYMMNRRLSGGNMYAQNAAADVMLFGEANFTPATTIVTSDFVGTNVVTSTNTQKRMHSNRSFNAVFLDGHVGRGF